jgi:hypothetical protein
MSCNNNATLFLLVGVLRHHKKAKFSRRQNVLLIEGCPNKNAGFNKVKKLFYFHEIAYIFTSL